MCPSIGSLPSAAVCRCPVCLVACASVRSGLPEPSIDARVRRSGGLNENLCPAWRTPLDGLVMFVLVGGSVAILAG